MFLNNTGARKVQLSADPGLPNYFNNGANVGIGVTSPQYALDVAGVIGSEGRNGFFSNGSNPYSLVIQNSAGGADGKLWVPMSVNGNQLISYVSNDANTVPLLALQLLALNHNHGYNLSTI